MGTILFEMTGVDRDLAFAAMHLAGSKLPFKTKFAERGAEE